MLPGQTVAIVGVGGEFPSSPTLDLFWNTIVNNVNTAQLPPPGRWLVDADTVYAAGIGTADRVYSTKACFLDAEPDTSRIAGLDLDPLFLTQLDPMFRLLLRVGRQALPDEMAQRHDLGRAGVIIGNLALPSETSSQLARNLMGRTLTEKLSSQRLSYEASTNPFNHYVAGLPAALLAKALAFQGTCFSVDAACASSLYAIKLACEELRTGRADLMLAGGLSRPDSLYTQMGFSQLRALSPSGTCSPFDARGDGLVVGEGCGLVLLKRTEDAVRDGDQILAVIRAVGLSNDLEGNLLAPASEGQLRAMRGAYQAARWSPADIDMIECHATGTPVGDAVEFNSMQTLWQDVSWRSGQCVIGSVKANIGHLLTAAGAAALIKVLLALKHRLLPPTVNFQDPAPGIALADSPFRILGQATRWEEPAGRPRRAAVSAFGFGGINAHLLLEEWQPQPQSKSSVASHPSFRQKNEPIAIVGMGCHFGAWDNLDKYRVRVFGGDSDCQPRPPRNWWGLEQTRWFRDQGLKPDSFKGYYVPEVTVAGGRFRIPPKEQEDMLPRQLLMLKVAADALKDARLSKEDLLFTGVFIGCGLDLNATGFSFRWSLEKMAPLWARELGLQLDSEQLAQWLEDLRSICGPALNANRVMGALGSVVASRIAKNFRIGGPAFTLSSEENSGLRALEVALHLLHEGTINRAVVGAVDLGGDVRQALSRHQLTPWSRSGEIRCFDPDADGSLIGEGAAAVILKRLADAEQDGDRIYAVVRETGTAIGGAVEQWGPTGEAYQRSLTQALSRARIGATDLSLVETDGSGVAAFDAMEKNALETLFSGQENPSACHIGSVKADIGHAGHAAGLASLVKTALALYEGILPPLRGHNLDPEQWGCCRIPETARYWLHNRQAGHRRALVSGIGGDGSCIHAVLEDFSQPASGARSLSNRPLGALTEGLFNLEGDDPNQLIAATAELERFLAERQSPDMDTLAADWLTQQPLKPDSRLCLSLIADSPVMLLEQLQFAARSLRGNPRQPIGGPQAHPLITASLRERIFYSPAPLAQEGKTAFVFPGSGNHFADMGREYSALWPAIFRAQEGENQRLAEQFQPDKFWRPQLADQLNQDHNALVISHVALCTALYDLVRSFGIRPKMISGYSLGESAGLFSTRAWTGRDQMLERLKRSSLFTSDLAGECRAAQRVWGLSPREEVDWLLGMVDVEAAAIRKKLKGRKQVYLLIINTYREAVIGGQRSAVEALVKDLGCHFIPLQGVTTVHCEVAKAVADAYRTLHLFDVQPPRDLDFYSCALGKKYPLSRENAADVILAQAIDTIDYPRVIEQLYEDGARIFVEIGPGSSCSRMISSILTDRPHLVRSVCVPGQNAATQLLRLLGACLAQRVAVDLQSLYPGRAPDTNPATSIAGIIAVPIGGPPFDLSKLINKHLKTNSFIEKHEVLDEVQPAAEEDMAAEAREFRSVPLLAGFDQCLEAGFAAHGAYLELSRELNQALTATLKQQFDLLRQLPASRMSSFTGHMAQSTGVAAGIKDSEESTAGEQNKRNLAFERELCLEFAVGSVARVLGPDFAEVDSYPTRVRLPDEPLMLVDRIIKVEGEARSLTQGRVITEHEVTADRWYLDGGRIPTCIAVEAGQADLFLSAYLGIDFRHQGRAVYRLLDAVVTFHRSLPVVGETICYDIHIDEFFRQNQTYLFRFRFEATVGGEPLLSMRNGCAGFFSAEELAAGQGIVHTRLDLLPQAGKRPADWCDPVPLALEAYREEQIRALYAGRLDQCFGPGFAHLSLKRPYTLPGGRLKLVDRVVELDPTGGRYGLGRITAEMDIHPDDWFLICHFVDDRVMPGTLMYECCLHTLRIYLLRLGWIGETGEVWYEPVPGVASGLKCRGQVIESTRTVTYQVSIKELGYRPEPFAIVDALMFADGHPIVEIPDMSLQLVGLSREKVEALWSQAKSLGTVPLRGQPPGQRRILYDRDRITAFAVGKPSAAFGEPYRIFDHERRIARLPGPPFQFLDRIVAIDGEPWQLQTGVRVQAEYDVPADAWYFQQQRRSQMPFCVLLEIALQPCGWLAAYLGSALTSEVDLSFRNLDGKAVQLRPVDNQSGTLVIDVEITRISRSGGMIIQHYDFCVSDAKGPVYRGDTVFGFFSADSLAQQVGIRDARTYQPTADEIKRAKKFSYPHHPPYPDEKLRMIDEIDLLAETGGSHGLGFIRGSKRVDPDEWFFKAHFYQDPVCPGSLGLESLLQLLKVIAVKRWGAEAEGQAETIILGKQHSWNYRGQIIPTNHLVTVEALITACDDARQLLQADGMLSVDGKSIYRMHDFGLCLGQTS